ncbi:MAG: Ig-like domain-containing protein, partial [Candidatus Limnocylindrales bacterium]|nr:Ig-like domain-containing protein [Candidatus Limnocylindrales bacterium]
SPLRVVTTLPYSGATDVPVTTGIELTFDQDGTVDVASHFSIEPVVNGRFEQHGRTVVFVPERLQPATLYTVTLRRGVRLQGSNQALEQDVVVRFETAPPAGRTQPSVSYQFVLPTMEWRTGDPPIVAIGISSSVWTSDAHQKAIRERPFRVAVYRLPSERAGTDAIRTLTEAPNWTLWSTPVVPIRGLARVLSFDAQPRSDTEWGQLWFRFPAPLGRGWYLVDGPGTPHGGQIVLQVTDVAAYVAATKDRLLVWANDTSTGGPLDGATVEVYGGDAIGRTGPDGLLIVATPSATSDGTTGSGQAGDRPFLAVRATGGRSLMIPAGLSDQWGGGDPATVGDRLWRFMAIDRQTYRQTDTINVWGFVRERDNGRVPADLELRLTSGWTYTGTDDAPPIMTVAVRPNATGAFSESIQFSDLPYGSYSLQLWSGADRIADDWLKVDLIRKPAYQVAVETDRHVLLAGDRVTLTARVTFFDGLAVPGVRLTTHLFGERSITTDRAGVATATANATTSNGGWYEDWSYVSVQPTQGEEGEISASASLLVFPASVRLDGEGTIGAGRVTVTGSLHQVAVERLERTWGTEAWNTVDRNGPSVAGAVVTAEIIELVPVHVGTRQIYDFIAKQVVSYEEYRIDEVARGTRRVTTGAGGSFHFTVPATADHDYRFALSTTDPQGRTTKLQIYASIPRTPDVWSLRPRLERSCGPANQLPHEWAGFAIGDPLCVAARDDRGDLPSGGSNRYLFFTAQRGLRDAVVSGAPIFEARFTAEDVPNLAVMGVRFTGEVMVPISSFDAGFNPKERELTVALATNRERYAPGETVTVNVRTTDQAGRPVSASVVLRAVDEKLFAIGAAYDPDPLGRLYWPVGTWILWTHSSHLLPPEQCGCGDTMGGGDDGRSVFVDSLLFEQVTTDAAGRARVSFKLSDDLTSWHVSAAAMTSVPEAGSASILVPVGLPFFVEATLAPDYLVTDEPIIRLRAYGSGLGEGDPVAFTVTSRSLGLPKTTIHGTAFEDVMLPLPKLSIGEHAITIAASSGAGATALSDRLTRRFRVIESRLIETRTTYTVLTAGTVPEGGPGFTTYVFTDAGRGRYLAVLQALAGSGGARVDQALAAAIARDLLIDEFGVDPNALPAATFDPDRYQSSGIALLPYSSTDLGLSVRVALL